MQGIAGQVADHWYARKALDKARSPAGDNFMICFRVAQDQLDQALALWRKGVSIGFFRSQEDRITAIEADKFDRVPLDANKSFEMVVALAGPRGSLESLLQQSAYVECLTAIEQSFLGERVRPSPCAVTKVLRGFDAVSNNDTISELAVSCGWGRAYVETSWTYRDARDRRRAFRVSFESDPVTDTVSTSQGLVILEDVMSRKQLEGLQPLRPEPSFFTQLAFGLRSRRRQL